MCNFIQIFSIAIPLLFAQQSLAFKWDNNACPEFHQYPSALFNKKCFHNPSVMSNTPNLITSNGYNYQTYRILTEDGYFIHIFRVFNGVPNKGQPVYLQHGFAHDSSSWVFSGNRSLTFNLVDNGYDVWLGNVRTTQYSKQHVKYTSDQPEYWDFTLDEMAKYDIRNCLQTVGNVTSEKIIFIGHSLGTTLAFMYLSDYPNDNLIQTFIALAPVVYFPLPGIAKPFLPIALGILSTMQSIGINAILQDIQPIHQFLQLACTAVPHLCIFSLNLIFGKTELFPPEDLTAYLSYFPDSFGVKQSEHSIQLAAADNLVKFDYGSKKNLQIYGNATPPDYNLEGIQQPVYLFHGENDAVATEDAVDRVYARLTAEKYVNKVPIGNDAENDQFNHINFLTAKNIQQLFYVDLINVLKKIAARA